MPKVKPCVPEVPKEEPYTLGLEQSFSRLRLRIYDETGEPLTGGILVAFDAYGYLVIAKKVDRKIAERAGIKLDHSGSVAIREY